MKQLILAIFTMFLTVVYSKTTKSNQKIGVCITTIPPRFSTLHESLISWFQQEAVPCKIYIFIPKKYKRFRQKPWSGAGQTHVNFVHHLEMLLSTDIVMSSYLKSGVIEVIEMDIDYGPITKFVGMLQLQQANSTGVDYWILADDDAQYASTTISKYLFTMPLLDPYSLGNTGLTHFSEDYRLAYRLRHESTLRRVLHVQGVDTYFVSNAIIAEHHRAKKLLHYMHFTKAVEFLHKRCPESFYQDDYVVSFLLNLANVNMHSIWNNYNAASAIEGLSRSNSQMHMHPDVFVREDMTKTCITKLANSLFDAYTSEWHNLDEL